MKYAIVGSCGCLQIARLYDTLEIIDSNLLPSTDISVIGILIDGILKNINGTFDTKFELVEYLNNTLKIVEGLEGKFDIDGNWITYQNIEEYTTIEIMAIYQNYRWVFAFGDAPQTNVNPEYIVDVANGNTITHPCLADEVLSVIVGNGNSQPITSEGYLHDPETNTITFANPLSDINVYVLTKQIPA